MIILLKRIFGKKAFPVQAIQPNSCIIQKAFQELLTGKVAVLFRNIYVFEYAISCCCCPLGKFSVFQSIFHTVAHIQHHFSAFGFGCVASSSVFASVNILVDETVFDVLSYSVSDFGDNIHVGCTSLVM